jgi:hypothetical protein
MKLMSSLSQLCNINRILSNEQEGMDIDSGSQEDSLKPFLTVLRDNLYQGVFSKQMLSIVLETLQTLNVNSISSISQLFLSKIQHDYGNHGVSAL